MKNNNLVLPDIDKVSERVHNSWLKSKQDAGLTTHLSANNEELMVPYDQLSHEAKDYNKLMVNNVYTCIQEEVDASTLAEEKTPQETLVEDQHQ
jgi:hypothetical protein